MDNKPFRQGTIDQFLDDLGSKKAAPGGGAAAGLVGAQACALAEMVCHLTEANKTTQNSTKKQPNMPPSFRWHAPSSSI